MLFNKEIKLSRLRKGNKFLYGKTVFIKTGQTSAKSEDGKEVYKDFGPYMHVPVTTRTFNATEAFEKKYGING